MARAWKSTDTRTLASDRIRPMKLQHKTWLIIAAINLVLVVTLYLILRSLIWENSIDLERAVVIRDVDRVMEALREQGDILERTVTSWADSHSVREALNPKGRADMDRCFPEEVLAPLHINLVILLGPQGKVVGSRGFDLDRLRSVPPPADVVRRLSSDPLISGRAPVRRGVEGILRLPEAAILLATRVISSPYGRRGNRGTVIAVTFLDGKAIARLAARANTRVVMLGLSDPRLPSDLLVNGTQGNEQSSMTTIVNADGSLSSYVPVRDMFGAPAFVLRVDTPSEIGERTAATLTFVLVLLLAAGFIFGGITILLVDISEEALRNSEAKFRSLFEQSLEGVAILTPNKTFVDFNDAFTELVGYDRTALKSMNFRELWEKADDEARWEAELHEKGSVKGFPWRVKRRDGSFREAILTSTARRGQDGSIQYQITCHDITGHREAERRIKAALKEKELLLNEVHHRVKNNLQVMSSLLALQAESIEDEKYRAIFRDAESRVVSMALVHENLHRSGESAWVKMDEYVHALVAEIYGLHEYAGNRIIVDIEAQDAGLGIDTAVPCGLMINELVSNAFEHAFPEGRTGKIRVAFRRAGDHDYELVVADDGVGMPSDMDWRQPKSFGLRLVNSLARQLRTEIQVKVAGGTEFRVPFSEPERRRRPSQDVQT